MKTSNAVFGLSLIIILLMLVAASVGLFWQAGVSPYPFTTLRGDIVQIYGHGLYRYDTTLAAIGYRVGDALTLILNIPALLVSLWLYRQGSLRGGFLLAGVFAFLIYTYGSLAFGAAYNSMFLVYLALMPASFFGLMLVFSSFDLMDLPAHFSPQLPRRGVGIYLIVTGVILLLIWFVLSILPALLAGKAPIEVWSYTTVITFVVDIGIVAPTLIFAGVKLLQHTPVGYLLASILLVFIILLGINLLTSGTVQMVVGLLNMGQFIGFVVSFGILTLFAAGFTWVLGRNVVDELM